MGRHAELADVNNRKSPLVPGAPGHGWNPCLPSLYTHKSDSFLKAVGEGGENPAWIRALARIKACGTPESTTWIGATDRLGERDSWMAPALCHERFHDGCRSHTVLEAIRGLQAEATVYGERALAVFTLSYPACEHELCRLWAWWRILSDVGTWRDAMKREQELEPCKVVIGFDEIYFTPRRLRRTKSGRRIRPYSRFEPIEVGLLTKFTRDTSSSRMRAVTVLEAHKSGWPHAHLVARMLPSQTEFIQVHRKGADRLREVAVGAELQRARRRWKRISGG